MLVVGSVVVDPGKSLWASAWRTDPGMDFVTQTYPDDSVGDRNHLEDDYCLVHDPCLFPGPLGARVLLLAPALYFGPQVVQARSMTDSVG